MSDQVLEPALFNMKQLADRFKLMMLDEPSRLGAAMIANGGCYWRNGMGGGSISFLGKSLELDARQSSQIKAILPIEFTVQANRMPQGGVSAHLHDLLEMTSMAVTASPLIATEPCPRDARRVLERECS